MSVFVAQGKAETAEMRHPIGVQTGGKPVPARSDDPEHALSPTHPYGGTSAPYPARRVYFAETVKP
jgi:hypothetical protein